MNIVFIYGPPGVGKRSVGLELARITGFKLIDNHTTINWATQFLDFGTPGMWKLEHELRNAVFNIAAEEGLNLIGTFVAPNPQVAEHAAQAVALARSTGGNGYFARLYCDQAALEERVQAAGRAELGKLTSVDVLRRMQSRSDLSLLMPGHDNLEIDNTLLQAKAAARQIANYFSLPRAEADPKDTMSSDL